MPLDTLIANLFEHSYEHWFCHKHRESARLDLVTCGFALLLACLSTAC